MCVQLAERYTPHSVDVASGLNIAAFNIGIAVGAWLGGHVVADMGLMNTPWIGGVIVLSALLLTRISATLDNHETATRLISQRPLEREVIDVCHDGF